MSRILRVLSLVLLTLPAAAAEPHWSQLDSTHFFVLTDGDEKQGREVIVHFEQMRAEFAQLLYKSRLNVSEPIDIIAFKDDAEYSKVAPAAQGAGLGSAFFLPGDDRYYFVLNLSKADSWRAVSRDFAQVLLTFNYPPTQTWFDTGFAEYFSSLRLTDKDMQIGGDPAADSSQSFSALLNSSIWLPLPQLFAEPPSNHSALFEAESWIVIHYLLNHEKLPSAGTYFGLVENERLPIDQAIQQAFGMSAAQMEQSVKDYFHSLPKQAPSPVPAPVAADVVGTSTHEIPPGQAQSLVAEMALRLPEHRDQARTQLSSIIDQPKMDNVVAHRALAWDFMQKKDFVRAGEELNTASNLDNKDGYTHYYSALYKYQQAQSNTHEIKGLANMMQDLHAVLDWNHEFAQAYYLLALAQTEGGGLRAANDSIRAAIQLSPRRTDYLLELARIYEDQKNWDAATALLDRLSTNSNSQIASAAKADLHDLPYVKKYGIPPVDSSALSNAGTSSSKNSTTSSPPAAQLNNSPASKDSSQLSEQDSDEVSVETSPLPKIDRRPIRYTKGKLIAVDCSQAPAAIITVSATGKTLKLRTSDYKSLMLVGADAFSCDWTNRSVSVNYKPGGKSDGDLVSLEVH